MSSEDQKTSGLLRVGYWWSEKKTKKFNANEFAQHCRANGLELIKLNFEEPLESQGPFSAIIHKLSDLLVKTDLGDPQAKQICQDFQSYVLGHPEVVVIDPLENVRKLLDRYKQYQLVQESKLGLTDAVFTPAFVELTTNDPKANAVKLKESNVLFPIVCKPLLAHGSTLAHQMTLIFCENGLNDIVPPCVAQTFVCHSAILYKLFIIGKNFYVIERPSLKNFTAKERPSIFFDSHDISKPHSSSPLNQLDAEDNIIPHCPDLTHLKHIAVVLQEELGLELLGIDVIVDSQSGHYAIIDMNTFPGYEGVSNVWQAMCDLIIDKIKQRESCLNDPNNEDKTIGKTTTKPCVVPEDDTQSINAADDDCSIVTIDPSDQKDCFQEPPSVTTNVPRHTIIPTNQTNERPCVESFDTTTEDSGIDTSDSCDEKKKCVKMVRRQHSRTVPVSPPATNIVTLAK